MKKYLVLLLISILLSAGILWLSWNQSETLSTYIELPKVTEEKYVSPISIDYLRSINIDSNVLIIEEELENGSNYKRFIASYRSEGYKVYGLLTIPEFDAPENGFPAIVFNHGYIQPSKYVTTEGYVSYVDYLAKNGFVVFKIDLRGHGKSEGDPTGSYFSSANTIDAISALKSLQKYEKVNSDRIGMWGHSMAGNLVLRAMLVSDEIKAGVIWSGAVYSYKDFVDYGISDSSYVHRPTTGKEKEGQERRESSPEIQKIRSETEEIDFEDDFWTSISLSKNIKYLEEPLQLHHALDDSVVNINYSRDLVSILDKNGSIYESYEYQGGGHNISSPYFDTAMKRTVEFFKENL